MPTTRTSGSIARATAANLVAGVGGKPMSQTAVDGIFDQAAALTAKVVAAYDTHVASGEVGADGAEVASDAEPIAGRGPTGLLYGRVQSGKTAAMIAASALAFDNGFRLVVVLTTNNVALVRQTARRFRALGGPRVLSTLLDGPEYEWEGEERALADDLRANGLVVVCAKDTAKHLPSVLRLLQSLNAARVPALVFDDEADAATPDTTLSARSAGQATAPDVASTTYRQVVDNPVPNDAGEVGESVRQLLPHHAFVQVTATPFVLFLQRGSSPLRPQFVHLSEPGQGYRGGEHFFAAFETPPPDAPAPLVLVASNESDQLVAARRDAPAGLQAALRFFLLAASAHVLTAGNRRFPDAGYKFLAHTSSRMDQHAHVAGVIRHFLEGTLRPALRTPRRAETQAAFAGAYEELKRTASDVPAPGLPPLQELLDLASQWFVEREIAVVNADTGEPRYGQSFNFVVGGNILGRGLTIDDLLVTYYLRRAQVSQMDTVWQHARMYGYRAALMPFTRVYLPEALAKLFRGIHETEEELRGILPDLAIADGEPVPIRVVAGTRPTRPNAVEKAATRLFQGGKQIRPVAAVTDPVLVDAATRELLPELARLRVRADLPELEGRLQTRTTDDIIKLVRMVPVDPDDVRFDPEAVVTVLETTRAHYRDLGSVYVRSTRPRRQDAERPSGVLTGQEQGLATRATGPVLALVYKSEDPAHPDPARAELWFPTLVLPSDGTRLIFNAL